jgi:hypothetical protein
MTTDDLTFEDFLEASDQYDVSDMENIPESVRERFNQRLDDVSE